VTKPLRLNITPYTNDPGYWGNSLVANAELLIGCLESAGARSVGEVGAFAGDLTRLLLEWAAQRDATVWAIDPLPQPGLEELATGRPDLHLVRQNSIDALGTIELPDAIIIDGDHNYYTVTKELEIIAKRAQGAELPLLLFHDVCWPHARRDSYYAPQDIPEADRQPIEVGGGVYPGEPGTTERGLPYKYPAAREGGERNGVLTAVEDHVASHDGLQFAVIPSFFGLGVAWHQDVPWAADVAALVAPYNRHPLLERLEANRVLHLAKTHAERVLYHQEKRRAWEREVFLRKLLQSKAFAVAERVSKVRQGGDPAISKAEILRLLDS
jgi:Methyltransferase domain